MKLQRGIMKSTVRLRSGLMRSSAIGLLLGGLGAVAPVLAQTRDTPDVVQGPALQSVIVTANKTKKVADAEQETAASTRMTLNSAQLAKYQQVGGISTGLLNNVPGVHAAGGDNTGVSEGNFNIRGFNYTEIGVIRDGVPLNDPLYQTAHIDFDGDPENYESISVIPGSAPLGAATLEASGGSILIKTVDPTDKPSVYLKEGAGNNNLFRTFGRFNTGAYNGFSAWVSVSHTTGSLWTQAPGSVRANRFEANIQYKSASGVKINLVASDFRMWTNAYFYPTLAEYNSLPYDATWQGPTLIPANDSNTAYQVGGSLARLNRADFHIQTFGLPVEIPISQDIKFSFNPYFVHVGGGAATVAAVPLSTGGVGAYGINPTQNRLGTTAQLDWKLPYNNTLSFGLWYDHLQADDQYAAIGISSSGAPVSTNGSGIVKDANGKNIYFKNQHDVINTTKFWIQDKWYITPQLQVTPGLGWQETRNRGTNIPSITAPTSGTYKHGYFTILPHLAISYQLNRLNQFYYDVTTNSRPPAIASVYSDTSQAAETAINQEIGWRYSSNGLLVDAAIFYDKFRNRQVSYSPNAAVTEYLNAGDVLTRGGQISVHGQLPLHFTYQGAWTYVNSQQQQNYNAGGVVAHTKGKQLYDTPNNIGLFGVGYDDGIFFGDVIGHYTGSFYGDLENTQRISSYTTVDLDAGYRFHINSLAVKSGTISLNINNLFNKHYLSGVESGSVSANPASTYYGSPAYFRGAPLSIFANIAFDFE